MLRTSGDVSPSRMSGIGKGGYAPHERRCFLLLALLVLLVSICSARAEMFLIYDVMNSLDRDMLRTSGDVSYLIVDAQGKYKYAPHERRCFFRIWKDII